MSTSIREVARSAPALIKTGMQSLKPNFGARTIKKLDHLDLAGIRSPATRDFGKQKGVLIASKDDFDPNPLSKATTYHRAKHALLKHKEVYVRGTFHVTDTDSALKWWESGIPAIKHEERLYIGKGYPQLMPYTNLIRCKDKTPAIVQLSVLDGINDEELEKYGVNKDKGGYGEHFIPTPIHKDNIDAIWVLLNDLTPELLEKHFHLTPDTLRALGPDGVAALRLDPSILEKLGYKG